MDGGHLAQNLFDAEISVSDEATRAADMLARPQ